VDEYIELESRINSLPIKEVDNFPEYFKEDVVKCLLCADPSRTAELEKAFRDCMGGKVSVYRSEAFYVEAMPLGVDKASSIAYMLPLIGLTREDCVACGDSYNDIGMIQFAGVGVAMGNAKPEVKEAADVITYSNEEDGLVPAELPEELKKYSKDGYSVTLMPGEINSDGFYFAKLRKEVK
jgi:Cof subfamily protein (haloacid dehalogenase superfamily)